ncbi:hypothetical protein [Staphylococcus capitis]|uniref:hypothetical protein n=1 Tax=Staphylococcus capitis TaxID=29388 RepID=UPI003D04422F
MPTEEYDAHVYETHRDLTDALPETAFLWRYMDLSRFVDLLQSKELHLARADQMQDRWEGVFGPTNAAMRPALYGNDSPALGELFKTMEEHSRTHTFLNCWYASDYESAAMWSIYDRVGRGVAIRTTKERLKRALTGSKPVYGATVEYVDYSNHYVSERNSFHPFLCKRRSFEHEREYRLMTTWSPQPIDDEGNIAPGSDIPPTGVRESVDLDDLVERVYVSPEAPGWFHGIVHRLVTDYGHDWVVEHSDLSSDNAPIY